MSFPFPDELSVDEDVLNALADQGVFAADNACIDAAGMPSKIKGPFDETQGLTGHELTAIAVRAAIRNLLANGLIEAKPMNELNEIFQRGVTVR